MKDHIAVFITPFIFETPIQLSTLPEQDFGLDTLIEYFSNGTGKFSRISIKNLSKILRVKLFLKPIFNTLTGHLTYPSLLYAQAFLSSSVAKKSSKSWPDLQLYFSYAGIYENLASDASRLTGVNFEDYQKYLSPYIGRQGLSIGVALVRPKSVGNIKLKNKDPTEMPVIDPRYLEHPDDIKAVIDGRLYLYIFQ